VGRSFGHGQRRMLCESVTVEASGRHDEGDGADTTVSAGRDEKAGSTCELYMQARISALGCGWHGYIIR
jgi:hypothetical protein